MLALMNTAGRPVAIEPDFIESVEQHPDNAERCIIRTGSGREHIIERSYRYVTGVMQAHFELRGNRRED